MESRFDGVPCSAAKVAPMAAPSYNPTTGIRAPLTADESDFDYSVSSMSRINSPASSYYSVTEVESEGFVSGEEESETDSERPYVTHQDDEILEETQFVKEYAFSEPSMFKPNGEIVRGNSNSIEYGFSRPYVKSSHEAFTQESGFHSGKPIFRPFVRSPDEMSYKGIANINNDSDDSRPLMSESGDELVEDEDYFPNKDDSRPIVSAMDESISQNELTLAVNIKIPVVRKMHIPIAQISCDSDDDSRASSEVFEDAGFSGMARIPSLEIIHRINSAPRVSMSEFDEGEDLIVNNGVCGEKEHTGVDDQVRFVLSADMIEDEDADDNVDVRADSLVVNEESIPETKKNVNLVHLDEEIQEEFDAIGDHRTCMDWVENNLVFNQDIGSEEQESGQEIESEVENSTFPTKPMVAEMERDQDFTSISGGEVLLDHSREIDGQIVTGSNKPLLDEDAGISNDHGQIVDYAAFLEAIGGTTSDDGTANISLDSNTADLGSIFNSRRPILAANGAKMSAMELASPAKGDLDFSLCIMVIGKTGVGKSATINSIFGDKKTEIHPFEPSTNHVKEIVGNLEGIKVKIFDTPGLRTSPIDQSINRKIFCSIKKVIKKTPPDVILYVDRLDTQNNNLNDLPLLKSITASLGSAIWRKSLIVLTHANSNPPDGPDGYPLSHEVFVAERSRVVQQLISRSSGELMMTNHPGSSILVENHQRNEYQEMAVHNGESWRSQLLFLCCSMMTLSDSKCAVGIQSFLNRKSIFGLQTPSSYFLTSLLQSNDYPKLSNDQGGVLIDYEVLKGERKIKNFKENEIGVDFAFLEENVVYGIKLEDCIAVGKELTLLGNAGFVLSLDDAAYGVNLDLCGKGDDYIKGQDQILAGLSVTRCRGEFLYGCNVQSQFSVGGNSKVNIVAGLNSKLNGQICVKARCCDQLQLTAVALIPIARAIFMKYFQKSN